MEQKNDLPNRIKILEVLQVGPGIEEEKDAVIARFPTRVRYCDASVDTHVAEMDPGTFINEGEVNISNWSANIEPGVYEQIAGNSKCIVFEIKEKLKQEAA